MEPRSMLRDTGPPLALLVLPALVPMMLVRQQVEATPEGRLEVRVQRAEQGDGQQHNFSRAPLWGRATEGEAFGDYAEAMALADDLRCDDERLLLELRLHPEQVSADRLEAFSERWRPAFAALSAGAHRATARPRIEADDLNSVPTSSLTIARDLINATTIEVRRRLARGEQRAAVELSLDAATFTVDLVHAPRLWEISLACALLAIVMPEGWRDEDLRQLDAEALSALAAGLARLDECWPLTYESTALVRHRTRASVDGGVHPPSTETDPPESDSRETLHGGSDSVERGLRTAAATVRLLRMAVAIHAGEPTPELEDPLGSGWLRCESRMNGTLELTSELGRNAGRTVGRRTVAPARER